MIVHEGFETEIWGSRLYPEIWDKNVGQIETHTHRTMYRVAPQLKKHWHKKILFSRSKRTPSTMNVAYQSIN